MQLTKKELKHLLEQAFYKGASYGLNVQNSKQHLSEQSIKEEFENFYSNIKSPFIILTRACKYCGGYFTVNGRIDTQYCDNIAPGETKTCQEIGALRIYQNKAFANPISKIYNREYKKRFARIRYGMTSKEQFKSWASVARDKRDACLNGELSLTEFKQWLEGENNNG